VTRPLRRVVALAAVVLASLSGCRAVGSGRGSTPAIDPNPTRVSGTAGSDPRVAALYASDFTVRSRAGEALVAQGEVALDLLGVAADAERGTPGPSRVGPVLAAVLAEVPEARLQGVHLQAPTPAVRAAAATELGRRDVWASVPALIDRIADEDGRVRASSIAALRRLTNRFYDVDLGLSAHAGAVVASRERTWWHREGATRPRRLGVGG